MTAFEVAEAQIVALFMESITYGMYLVTLVICARALFFDAQGIKRILNWPMIVVMTLMAIFATLDVALGLRHNLEAFIYYSGPGGPEAEFDNISYWVNVMKTVDTQAMSLIGDGMLIYRCFVIYSRSWKIILLPILMWLADVACSVMIIFITATLRKDAVLSQQGLLKPFLLSFLIITIVLNFLTTGIIVWRIWSINKETAPHVTQKTSHKVPRTRLEQTIRIIIESGMLYTLFVIITFICELAGSNAIYGTSCTMIQVVGISFNLIIIRVDQTNHSLSASFVDSAAPASHPLRLMRSSVGTGMSRSHGMEIMISRDVDRDVDSMKNDAISVIKPEGERGDAWNAL